MPVHRETAKLDVSRSLLRRQDGATSEIEVSVVPAVRNNRVQWAEDSNERRIDAARDRRAEETDYTAGELAEPRLDKPRRQLVLKQKPLSQDKSRGEAGPATTPQIAVLILPPHTLLDWVRSRACSKSSQMSGGKASSLAVMRFIAMRLAVFRTP